MIKLPGRQYPGVVFQGDSLATLVCDLLDVRTALERDETDSASRELDAVIERLQEIKSAHEQALSANQINPPYS